MGSFSVWHWVIVLVIILLVFGTKKLRNIGSDLGGAVRGFKDGMKEGGKSESEASAAPAAGTTTAKVESKTIDVEAKDKSSSQAQ